VSPVSGLQRSKDIHHPISISPLEAGLDILIGYYWQHPKTKNTTGKKKTIRSIYLGRDVKP
jgi:hypothetical protein